MDEWQKSGKKGGMKGSMSSKPDWYSDKDKGSKGKGQEQERNPMFLRLRRARLSIQVDQQHGRRRGPRLVVGK